MKSCCELARRREGDSGLAFFILLAAPVLGCVIARLSYAAHRCIPCLTGVAGTPGDGEPRLSGGADGTSPEASWQARVSLVRYVSEAAAVARTRAALPLSPVSRLHGEAECFAEAPR